MADASSMDVPDELVGQLMAIIPNLSVDQCKELLVKHDFDVQEATESYFNEPEAATAGPSSSSAAAPDNYTGPRTLDGRPAPQSSSSSRAASKKPQKKTGISTLSSISNAAAAQDPEDDESDDDQDDARGPRDTYAGGEKSGLAVQDPNQRSGSDPQRLINDILAKARSNARRPESNSPAGPSEPAVPASFRGSGQTLGGEGVESRTIPDPRGSAAPTRPESAEVQERTLHLWRDGFSIDDGELRRFDDPANADALRMIQQGRAPIHLMNVRFDEPLDVKLQQHDENWRPLPKVYRPFGGEGHRLGSPVPGASTASPSTSAATPATASTSEHASAPSHVDESQPTVMIRLQLLDGTRLPARFNLTQTVGDMYDFIARSSPDLIGGNWVVATTFPNKDHTDKSLVIGDMAEFKKGGTAMVKKC